MQTLLEKSGVLDKIIDFIEDKSGIKVNRDGAPASSDRYLGGSISEYTKNLIMTFPVMCDNSLPPDTASMISRANERNIIAMLQLLFASINLKGSDGVKMLSKIHKNFSINMAADDFIEKMNQLANENDMSLLKDPKTAQAVREMVRVLKTPQKSFPISDFSEKSLNEYFVYNVYGKTIVREADTRLDSAKKYEEVLDRVSNKYNTSQQDLLKVTDQINRANEFERSHELNQQKYGLDKFKTSVDYSKAMLLNQDIKKFNELAPSLLIIKFNNVDAEGAMNAQDTFIAGVKSRLIAVDASDIVERLIAKNKTKLSFLNFIRATTGEIGFVSDFLLCTKQAKIDAKNAVKKGPAAKMWSALEYRAAKNTSNKFQKTGNDASAITTLVVNQETVNLMKKEFNFDLERMSNTKLIIDSYNLLGICICDESIGVAKVCYVGNDNYESQAYSFLEKEQGNDKTYKDMINLLNTRR